MAYYSDVVITFRTYENCTPEKFLEAFAQAHPQAAQLVRESGHLERKDGSENTMIARFDGVKWYTHRVIYADVWDIRSYRSYTHTPEPGFETEEAFETLVTWCEDMADDAMFANDGAFVRIGENDDDNETRYWGQDAFEMARIVRTIDYMF
jgi:hypothetical protein